MTSSAQRTKLLCEICDADSVGVNFGVRTCMACKAFFRRNAARLGNYDFICPKDGDCSIRRSEHPICKCCRLAKCFQLGMKKELILTELEKEGRRIVIEQNREKRRRQRDKSLKLVIIRPIPQYKYFLTLDDQQILSNIFNLYETHCIDKKSSLIRQFPTLSHTRVHSFFNEYSKSHELLVSYLKSVPEFNLVPIDDRVRLIRNHFGFINNIHAAIMHPTITSDFIVSASNVFGIPLAGRLFESIERIQMFTRDMYILRLLLIVLTFSSADLRNREDTDMNQICSNTLLIFSTQNTYVELLWKYILSKSSNEIEAVKFFDQLIRFLMYLLDVHLLLDGYINSQSHEIEQMEPLMKCMWPSPVATNVSVQNK